MNDLSEYLFVKDDMKTGDLLQWHSEGSPVGWAICLRTGGYFTHSSLVIRLAEYEGLERHRFTQEAVGRGVMLNLLSRRLERYHGSVWWYPLKDEFDSQRRGIGEIALAHTGVPYDYHSLLRQLLGRVFPATNALFCSELVAICYGIDGEVPWPDELHKLNMFRAGVKLI